MNVRATDRFSQTVFSFSLNDQLGDDFVKENNRVLEGSKFFILLKKTTKIFLRSFPSAEPSSLSRSNFQKVQFFSLK